MRVLPTATKLAAPVASIRERYWPLFYPVLLGLAGPLAIAVTPDSQHIFWAAILLLAVAVACVGPGPGKVPYGPMSAVLPLPIAAAVTGSGATPSLLALTAAAMVSYWGIRSAHRRAVQPPEVTAPLEQHPVEKDDKSERRAMQLLAAASHDLRQPVQALLAQVELIGGEGDRDSISPRQFAELETSVNTLAEMLDDLLDVSRVNMGIYEAKLRPVNVGLLLKEAGQVFSVNANAKGLRLLVECPDDVWINSDLKLLRRIVFNLVANAVRYTDAGGIRLSCLLARGRVLLQVEDTGQGMKAGDLAAKGAEFELRPTTSYQGLGLGLGIVNTMALQLGHKLRAASEPGEGTQIEVDLGERVAAGPAMEQAAGMTRPLGSDITVAIAEDDAAVRWALENILASWGCRTVSADSSQELVAQLRRSGTTPQLLISDLHLRATETGLDVIRALRENYQDPEIPAVILTGDVLAELKPDAALPGVCVLHKPVRPSDLRKVVTELVLASRLTATSQTTGQAP